MQLSFYNTDAFEYSGIVDIPDNLALSIEKFAEQAGLNIEDYIIYLLTAHFESLDSSE
jgi:hypothetical protein